MLFPTRSEVRGNVMFMSDVASCAEHAGIVKNIVSCWTCARLWCLANLITLSKKTTHYKWYCDITMPLSLKTIGSAGYRDQWNKRLRRVLVKKDSSVLPPTYLIWLYTYISVLCCIFTLYQVNNIYVYYQCICYDSFLTFHMLNYYNKYYDHPTSLAF